MTGLPPAPPKSGIPKPPSKHLVPNGCRGLPLPQALPAMIGKARRRDNGRAGDGRYQASVTAMV